MFKVTVFDGGSAARLTAEFDCAVAAERFADALPTVVTVNGAAFAVRRVQVRPVAWEPEFAAAGAL